MKRVKIRPAVAARALERTEWRCALCLTGLLGSELHHLEFVSRGGTNDGFNLVPLCVSCHRDVAHRVYGADDAWALGAASRRSLALIETARRVAGADSWSDRAKALVMPYVRDCGLSNGAYRLVRELAESVLDQPRRSSVDDAVLELQLVCLAVTMAVYEDSVPGCLDRLDQSFGAVSQADLPMEVTNTFALDRAKVCDVMGEPGQEAASLSMVSTLGNDQSSLEFLFRRGSFEFRTARARPVGPGSPSRAARPFADRLFAANIATDEAQWLRFAGESETAHNVLVSTYAEARSTFHRRGMFVRSLLLADLCADVGEMDRAGRWLLIGERFREAGRNLPLDVERLRQTIIQRGGANSLRVANLRPIDMEHLGSAL